MTHPLNLLKTSFFGANPRKLQQRLLNTSPITAKNSIVLGCFIHQTKKQGNGAAHQKPIKRVGAVGPLLPTTLAISQKNGRKQRKKYQQPTEQLLQTAYTALSLCEVADPYFNEFLLQMYQGSTDLTKQTENNHMMEPESQIQNKHALKNH